MLIWQTLGCAVHHCVLRLGLNLVVRLRCPWLRAGIVAVRGWLLGCWLILFRVATAAAARFGTARVAAGEAAAAAFEAAATNAEDAEEDGEDDEGGDDYCYDDGPSVFTVVSY